MKKFLIITLWGLGSIICLIYLAFLIIPPCINLDNYKSEIQKLVLDNSKLNLDYSKLQLYSTPLLSAGVIVKDIELKLDDNSTLFKTPRIKVGLALPSLLTLTVKTSKCYIDKPYINLEIVDNKQYKIVKVVEDIINENNKKPAPEPLDEKYVKLIEKIRIKVPSILISDYCLNINNSNHSLNLKGDKLLLGYISKTNTFKINTNSQLLSDNKENINAKIRLKVSLPEFETAQKEEVDPDETIKIPFIDIIKIYQTYDLRANLDTRLNIKPHSTRGYLNIDDLNLKLSDIRLPNSYLHTKFSGKKIEYDSNIYAKSDEKISLLGLIKYDKNPKLKTQITSDKISFSNLLILSKALLDSLNIKNDLASIKTSGYLRANTSIDTDFKKLKSQGSILIKDGYFINKASQIGIKDINADLIFDNNALDIKDTRAIINNSKVALEGNIDNCANTNIKADINNLSIAALYNAFAPRELKRQYLLNSANLDALVNIKGKLDSLSADITTKLSNLSLSDSKKTMFVLNKAVDINFKADPKTIEGTLQNSGFSFSMPKINTKILVDSLNININNEEIKINPFDLNYNSIAKANIKGEIENYLKNPEIDVFISGLIPTAAIKQTLGKEISYYLSSKGTIPAKVSIKGDSKKQDILAQIYSDSNNYITPVNIKELTNAPSLIQADIKLSANKIKIKDTGLYKKASSGFSDELEENIKGANQLVEITSTIDKDHINLFRFKTLKDLSASIAVFKKSNLALKGKLLAHGNFDDINYSGNFNVSNLTIPEILFKLANLDINLSKKINLKAHQIDLNGSKINASLDSDLMFSKISNINVESDLIDVDNSMKVLDALLKYTPPASNSTTTTPQDIPINAEGKFNIKKITTGEIVVDDAKGNIEVKNNNFYINKLSSKAFEGAINGDISMNLITSLLTIKLNGKNLDADKLMAQGAGLKDTLSGTLNFKTDISLKGATYLEQVKSLKGTVDFDAKNGQYGPFSKLENFFLAENIRENALFKNTIGIILTPLATIDSSRYETLKGAISFNKGIATLSSIASQGDILCVLIKGNMNLVNNVLDATVRARLASAVSDMLGPLSVANPVNLVKNTPGLNIGTAKLFSVFSQAVTNDEYNEIPMFSKDHSDANATKFQIILSGDTAKPLKLVKSFKWLALQEDIDKAQAFSDSYIKEQEQKVKEELLKKLQEEYEKNNKLKVTTQKILQMDTTAPKVKEEILNEVIKKVETSKQLQEEKQQALEKKAKDTVGGFVQKLQTQLETGAKKQIDE